MPVETRVWFWVRSVRRTSAACADMLDLTCKTCEKGSKITFYGGNGVVRISTLQEKLLLISPVRLILYTDTKRIIQIIKIYPLLTGLETRLETGWEITPGLEIIFCPTFHISSLVLDVSVKFNKLPHSSACDRWSEKFNEVSTSPRLCWISLKHKNI